MPNTPTKTRPRITPEGQAAAGRIAEFRQNVNNGATAPQARAIVNQVTAGQATPVAPVPTPAASTISATSLAPATPMTLATPVPATQAQGMMAEFTDGVDTYTQNLADQAKAAEAPKANALNDYISQLTTAKGVTGLSNDAYAVKGGVNDITPELNDINDKIRREQLSARRRTEAIAGQGQSKAQSAAQVANIERESFAKQADLSIIQQAVQGRYDSAKEIADRAVSAQLEKQTNDLAILKFNYDENKELFTKAEQRSFEAAQGDRERKLEKERQDLSDIKQFALSALQAGASTAEVQKAMQSKTMDEAISLVGGYLRPKPAAVSTKAPDLQNFGTATEPMWKQYNTSTGAWEDVSGLGTGGTGTPDVAQKGLDQVRFLRGTITDAKDLVGATGPNAITRGLGNVFVGNTQVKQLQNKIDTLKTNLLTLNSDPALKKFFGPQMSEKDTELLLSAGSTLDAYSNSVKDNEEELVRYDNLLKKIETSLAKAQPASSGTTENIVTAPDGKEYVFTD